MRLIDADALDRLSWNDRDRGTTFDDGILWILEKIDKLPTIEPERKKGKWYAIGNTGRAICECGYITYGYSVYNFCPKCGVNMRGGSND